MKKLSVLLVVALVVALSAPLVAGEKYKCTADTQHCLNQMAASLKERGWVGLEMDQDEETGALTVNKVVPDSPAVAAGFEVGDQLVAFQGLRYGDADEAALKEAKMAMKPGNTVTYTVLRVGTEKDLEVTLGKLPEQVLAQWVGSHMLDHAVIAQAGN